jgi:apolipoprotein D and lipocalin family protein
MNRTTPLALLLALALVAPAAADVESQEPLKSVPSLDLQRYAGTWHEIARLPMEQEADCVREVTATYTLRPDGRIDVRNECIRADGEREVATGIARRGDAPGRLEVRFAPGWLSPLPFVWADYWVIAIDDDYRWAIVGEPDREYLWFLSRDPEIDERTLEDLKGRARMLGYELDELIVNPR